MRKLLTMLFLLMAGTAMHAQTYIVYTVTGEVMKVEGKEKTLLAVRKKVVPTTVLNIPEKSMVRLFDHAGHKIVTLNGKCQGTVKQLIEQQDGAEKTVTPQYFAYIIKNLKGKLVTNTVETDNATTIFRDDADSLFIKPATIPDEEKE
jgi:hypothetical protein